MTRRVPVLIVGGGPVGLALAGELGWRGIGCELIEQTDGAIASPKMNEVNARSMEICRRWGIADQVFNCPFPADWPLDVAFVTSLSGYELSRLPRPGRSGQQPRRRKARTGCRPARRSGSTRSCVNSPAAFSTVRLRHRVPARRFRADRRRRVRAESPISRAAGPRRSKPNISSAATAPAAWCAGALGIELDGQGTIGHPINLFFRAPEPGRALRQAAGDVLSRHRRDRAVGQPPHHRSGERPVAADDRFHRRRRHARHRRPRVLSAPRARRRFPGRMGRRQHLAAAQRARRKLRPRPRVPRRRRGASAFADRRHGHEHRRRRRRRSRLEARRRARKAGAARRCWTATTPNAVRSANAPCGWRRSSTRTARSFRRAMPALIEDSEQGARLRARGRRAVAARHRSGIPHRRLAARLPLRGLADLRRRRHARAAGRSRRLHALGAAGLARAACLPARRPIDPRSLRPRLHAAAVSRRAASRRQSRLRRRRAACR